MQATPQTPPREFEFSDRDFEFLRKLVKEKAGIVLADHKRNMVYSRIARRFRALGLNRGEDYVALLAKPNSVELPELLNAITTNLTHFFRENHHFEFLAQQFSAGGRFNTADRIRVWSAGCSAGMEPYSIAMTLCEALENKARQVKILATDLDSTMLDRGREGKYRLDDVEAIPTAYKKKYLHITPHGAQVQTQLRQMIHYKLLNLMQQSWPLKGPFQIIFCRNVMIYFDKETQKVLVGKFAQLLQPGGFLIIGHSENVSGMHPNLKLIVRTIYEKS